MTTITPIKGLLIGTDEISEITITSKNRVKAIAEAIGCDVFTVVGLEDGIDVYVDDEGLLNGSPLNLVLTILVHKLGFPAALCGKGLVVSADEEGDTVSLSESQRATVEAALSNPPDEATIERLCQSLSPLPGVVALLRAPR